MTNYDNWKLSDPNDLPDNKKREPDDSMILDDDEYFELEKQSFEQFRLIKPYLQRGNQ